MFLDTVLEHYKKTLLVESQTVQLFKGMQELLDQLKAKGFKSAITSNKPKDTLLQFVNTQNIQVDVAIGVCDDTKPKPDKCMIDQLRKLYPGHKIILVGDTEIDYQTAVNAQIDSVIVSYGFRTVEELRSFGIAELVPSVEELSRVLLG
ncbi:Phosphoglycolate_phosphatase [Hexamita inflata]|uniref:Phosphoglycolate_phosphatase n=1 Tax=Hexamita inflata TaxID=28002 RepID=A0ABP1GDR6_9EUKA